MSAQDATAGAPAALKDHEVAALVNRLRDIAVRYRDTRQLRERIAQEIVPVRAALTAAQPAPQQGAYAKLLSQIEDALDAADATVRRDDGHWLSMPERVADLASRGQAPAGAADWWRKRADEIEDQVARSGSIPAMACFTDMRTLLQAATAQQAPAPAGVAAQGEALDGYVTAFYEIAKLLDIGARPDSPAKVWREEMLPCLHSAIAAAKRYRWLRHGDNDEKVLCNGPVAKDYWYLLRGEKLDAAIDAAIAAKGEKA